MDGHVNADRFLFVRHGQTRWNLERRLQGRSDIPLNETGRAQAQDCADLLAGCRIAAIISSPLQRAHQTAQAIAARSGARVITDDALIERSFGDYEGQLVEDIRPKDVDGVMFSAMDLSHVGAEPWAKVCARATRCVDRWSTTYAPGEVAFVSHYGLFTALRQVLTGAIEPAKNASPYRFLRETDWRVVDLAAPNTQQDRS